MQANQEAVCGFLWRSALQNPDFQTAYSLLHHLAFIYGWQLRVLLRDQPQAWQQLVREEADRRLEQLAQLALDGGSADEAAPPGQGTEQGERSPAGAGGGAAVGQPHWYAPPPALPALAEGGSGSSRGPAPAQQCQRMLQYLTMLLEQCQVGSRHDAHFAARIPSLCALGKSPGLVLKIAGCLKDGGVARGQVLPGFCVASVGGARQGVGCHPMGQPSTRSCACCLCVQGRRMPSPNAHRSAYQGFELTVNVQLPAQQVRSSMA